MPRRSSTRITASAAVAPEVPQVQQPLDPLSENFKNLRQHWKWAAFCQFYYVFFDLFNINDVSVEDIENDLIHGTDVFLPRIMQRLLFTLSYDRKISLDNWQNALRRQYDRRNPEANPLGSPSTVQTATNSRHTSVFKDEGEELDPEDHENKENGVGEGQEDAEAKETADTASRDEGTAPPKNTKTSERAASTTEERVTVDWSELSMDQKLESLHTVVEWQFQNPLRLRQLMKSDDEGATWRSEPVGYDKEANTYWLIGGNRLWIQRAPPKPPTRKRKRKAEPEPKSRGAGKGGSSKRQRTSKSQTSTKPKPKAKAKPAPKAKEPPPTPTTGRSSRAAKEQAKVKLDAQAKALEEFKRETAGVAAASTSGRATRSRQVASKPAPAPTPTKQTAGTRISARLRGAQQEDEWQKIPDDWLAEDRNAKTGLESDGEASELTELSDEEVEEEQREEEPEEDGQKEEPEKEEEEPTPVNADFIEWETLCVSLAEWEAFPERFAKSTYYAEKAFYKLLTTVIVPEVAAELRAIEQKRRAEEALNHRKRSSRLATRENEKEAAKLAAQHKAEEEEKMSRTRRLEARQQREEAERLKKEKAREERRLKRETRIVEQEAEETPEEEEEEQPPPQPQQQPEQRPKRAATKREHDVLQAKAEPRKRVRSQSKKTANSKANDDWELNCEVCGMTGKNLDDGKPMMCCGLCNKWQHIPCHDSRDARMGRPKRDWNKIDFFCARCLVTKANGAHNAHPAHPSSSHRYQQHVYPHAGANGASHLGQLPYGQVAGQQSSWQPPAVPYNLKPATSGAQGYPEPSAYAQSYLAPTSSVRSSTYGHPSQSGHAPQHAGSVHGQGYGSHAQGYGATAYGGGNISFSHYQPQERVFTSEAERAAHHGQQNSYYRMNGHSGYGYPPQQTYPSQQHGWSGSGSHHYTSAAQSYPSSSAAPMPHRPAAYDGSSAQRSTYDSLARDAQAYRQQPTPPAPIPVQGQAPVPTPPAPTANGHYDRGAAAYSPPAA